MQSREDLYPTHYLVSHTVPPSSDGARLDHFLKDRYSRRTRGQIQRAIGEGKIQILREQSPHLHVGKIKSSSQLYTGDVVQITSERKPEPVVDFNYKVLYEDDALFVIDKPGNLPVHPAGGFFFHTLLTHLQTRGFTQALDADHPYYLAHRIDRETSGILVLTKTPEDCAAITAQFRARETQKTYLAIVHGSPAQDEFESDQPIGRIPGSKIRIAMGVLPEDQGGQVAHTDFHVLKRTRNFALIECTPKTGRQHQIRVHLADAGHPIVGDKIYSLPVEQALRFFTRPRPGSKEDQEENTGTFITPEIEARLILPRHALHAARLRLAHPRTGAAMDFRSELPVELSNFILGKEHSE